MTYNIRRALAERRGEEYTESMPAPESSYDIALRKSAPELMPEDIVVTKPKGKKAGGKKGVERLASLPFSEIEEMMIDADLSLETLGQLLGAAVSRVTWYRWRSDFGAVPAHVITIIKMARLIGPEGIKTVI